MYSTVPRWRLARRLGYAASAWCFIFAAISFYWAAGGTAGLETLGTTLMRLALTRDPAAVLLGGWLAGLVKLGAGVTLLLLIAGAPLPLSHNLIRRGVWLAGVGMVLYGGLSLVQHALMLSGALKLPAGLGRAGAWGHLAIWDPWWLLGGALFVATGRLLRPRTLGWSARGAV